MANINIRQTNKDKNNIKWNHFKNLDDLSSDS